MVSTPSWSAGDCEVYPTYGTSGRYDGRWGQRCPGVESGVESVGDYSEVFIFCMVSSHISKKQTYNIYIYIDGESGYSGGGGELHDFSWKLELRTQNKCVEFGMLEPLSGFEELLHVPKVVHGSNLYILIFHRLIRKSLCNRRHFSYRIIGR